MIKNFSSATFLLIFFVITALSQTTPDEAAQKAQDQFTNIKIRSIEMERVRRDSYKRSVNDNLTVEFPKIKDDFEQIQQINSEILKLAAAKTPSNYAAVLKFASEINHRAARLNLNLFSAEFKQNKENDQEIVSPPQELKVLLTNLDKSVNDFAHSSMFQNLNLVNPDDSLNAQKELETVIKISSSIKETTKKLIKDNSKK